MRRYLLIVIMTALCAVAFAQEYRGGVAFDVKELSERNDSLHMKIKISVYGNAVQKIAGVRIIPELSDENNRTYLFPDVMFQGWNKNMSYERSYELMNKKQRSAFARPEIFIPVVKDRDTTFMFEYKIPYELWMDSARLFMRQELIGYRDHRSIFVYSMNDKVKLDVRPVYEVQPQVAYIKPEKEIKTRQKQGQAYLDFQVGRSVIMPNYRRNPEELAKIRAAFEEVSAESDVTLTGLFIEGYASPEGRYDMNDRLAKERSNSLADYISKNFSLPFGRGKIKVEWTAEDWGGFKVLVEESEIAQKERILEIINSTDSPDAKEVKLRALGAPYSVMLRDIFPELRRVEYQIYYMIKDYTDVEARNLVGKKSQLLSQLELYSVALSYGKDSEEFDNIIMELIPKLYPDNATATINATARMIERGELPTAQRLLEKLPENPYALNNLGTIHLYVGDLEQAKELFEKALRMGVAEAEANLKEVELKREDNVKQERYRNR